jgi:hypothetical protein
MAHYIYVPALARQAIMNVADKTPLEKIERMGDNWLTKAVKKLIEKHGATILPPRKPLNWIDTEDPKYKKFFKVMASKKADNPAWDNLLARAPGTQPGALLNLTAGQAAAHHDNCTTGIYIGQMTSIASGGGGGLANVGVGDTLYVVGHGNPGGGILCYKDHDLQRCKKIDCKLGNAAHMKLWILDPTTLGALLSAETLTPLFKELHCVMCFSGGYKTEKHQKTMPYAERLATDLVGRGYAKVKVKGALGLVMEDMTVKGNLKKTSWFYESGPAKYEVEVTKEEYEAASKWYAGIPVAVEGPGA